MGGGSVLSQRVSAKRFRRRKSQRIRRRVLFMATGGNQARFIQLGFDGRKKQPLFTGADVEDLDDGHAGDPEKV